MASSAGGTVFRGPVARGFGYVWLAFVALNLVDIALRGDDRAAAVTAAALATGTAVVYVACLRPRIHADEDGVSVHNPLRDVWVPWAAVDHIDATDVIRIHTGGRPLRCWVLPAPNRARARPDPRTRPKGQPGGRTTSTGPSQPTLDRLAGRTRTEYVAGELDSMARRHQAAGGDDDPGRAVVRWSFPALAALSVSLALLAGVLLLV